MTRADRDFTAHMLEKDSRSFHQRRARLIFLVTIFQPLINFQIHISSSFESNRTDMVFLKDIPLITLTSRNKSCFLQSTPISSLSLKDISLLPKTGRNKNSLLESIHTNTACLKDIPLVPQTGRIIEVVSLKLFTSLMLLLNIFYWSLRLFELKVFFLSKVLFS